MGLIVGRYVIHSLGQGYQITHIGILIAIDLPPATRVPEGRVWMLTLEGDFTYRFWTVYQKNMAERSLERSWTEDHHKMAHACPWDRNDFEYDGLNSHCPLSEKVRDLQLTPEELLQQQ